MLLLQDSPPPPPMPTHSCAPCSLCKTPPPPRLFQKQPFHWLEKSGRKEKHVENRRCNVCCQTKLMAGMFPCTCRRARGCWNSLAEPPRLWLSPGVLLSLPKTNSRFATQRSLTLNNTLLCLTRAALESDGTSQDSLRKM